MADHPPKQELTFFDQIGKDMADVSAEDKKLLQAFGDQGMKEEAKGLPIIAPRVDILHQGTAAFKFRDAPEEEQIKKTFEAVIIHVDPQRAFWKEEMGEGEGAGQMPDCFSRDLIVPDPQAADRQSDKCGTCRHNDFGSDPKGGRGKGCKEMRRVFFLPSGKLDAHVMNVPPTSLKSLKTYFTFLAENKIQRPQFVVTKFAAKNAENKGGIEFSQLNLSLVKKLDERVILFVLEMKKGIESMLQTAAPISRDDFQGKTIDAPPQGH
jgi:hypothetical protein